MLAILTMERAFLSPRLKGMNPLHIQKAPLTLMDIVRSKVSSEVVRIVPVGTHLNYFKYAKGNQDWLWIKWHRLTLPCTVE